MFSITVFAFRYMLVQISTMNYRVGIYTVESCGALYFYFRVGDIVYLVTFEHNIKIVESTFGFYWNIKCFAIVHSLVGVFKYLFFCHSAPKYARIRPTLESLESNQTVPFEGRIPDSISRIERQDLSFENWWTLLLVIEAQPVDFNKKPVHS